MRLAVLLAAVAAVLSAAPAGASEPPIAAEPAVAGQPPSPMSVSVSPSGASLPYYGTITVSVTVTNISPAPLFGLTSSLCDFVDTGPFPPGLPRLAPGASVTFPCELGPLVPFDRQVVIPVDARDDAFLPVFALGYFAADVGPPTSSASVAYRIDGADPGAPEVALTRPLGSAIELAVVVTNTGPDRLRDLTLTDLELGAIACPAATLEPGQSMRCGPRTVPVDRVDIVLDIVSLTAYGTDGAPIGGGDAFRRRGLDPTPPCPATADMLRGMTVQVDGGPVRGDLTGLRVRSGNILVVRWASMAPGTEGCRISLVQYATPRRSFDPAVEQTLLAATSCAGAGCRVATSADLTGGEGYELRLFVYGMDTPAQFDLVTGTPLAGVGPSSGYYSGWLSGGTHRLIAAGTSPAA